MGIMFNLSRTLEGVMARGVDLRQARLNLRAVRTSAREPRPVLRRSPWCVRRSPSHRFPIGRRP